MSKMFQGCTSLISLPDISKWNIDNVKYLNGLFYECSSLKELPDISKWDINNESKIKKFIINCSKEKSDKTDLKKKLQNGLVLI